MERRLFIKSFALSSGALFLVPKKILMNNPDEKTIRVLMIYNNTGTKKNFINDWGSSFWIESENNALLYDTGADPSILSKNMVGSGIDLNILSKIVISHNHLDHINGLSLVLERTNYKPVIYVPDFDLESFKSKYPKAECIGITDATRITENILTTGQFEGKFRNEIIHEQSIILVQDDTIVLLTGCSHPGIVEIIQKTREIHPDKKISFVAGGFHLNEHSEEQIKEISARLKNFKVEKIAPSHCTGEQAINIFKDDWGDRFVDFNNGNEIKL